MISDAWQEEAASVPEPVRRHCKRLPSVVKEISSSAEPRQPLAGRLLRWRRDLVAHLRGYGPALRCLHAAVTDAGANCRSLSLFAMEVQRLSGQFGSGNNAIRGDGKWGWLVHAKGPSSRAHDNWAAKLHSRLLVIEWAEALQLLRRCEACYEPDSNIREEIRKLITGITAFQDPNSQRLASERSHSGQPRPLLVPNHRITGSHIPHTAYIYKRFCWSVHRYADKLLRLGIRFGFGFGWDGMGGERERERIGLRAGGCLKKLTAPMLLFF